MKAALYARVSTDEQAQRENSIPAQLRALREYCKREHIEIYKEYTDEGISGQKLERPAFQDMLSAAYDGKFNLILYLLQNPLKIVLWAFLWKACMN